jgi:hypothetical protein
MVKAGEDRELEAGKGNAPPSGVGGKLDPGFHPSATGSLADGALELEVRQPQSRYSGSR